jgi:glycosyltransferase involved in cell wall biosynthesis
MSGTNINFSQPTIVLSMIVKNESKIITRLLESVLPIIDTYCICDTGSTDDTVIVIQDYMKEAGKMGSVLHVPFKNFGYNRTVALNAAAAWGTYALLLDADMKLIIDPSFKKSDLVHNAYQIKQSGGNLEYYNIRLIKTNSKAKCVGPTHEYYDVSGTVGRLETLHIADIGDGGCKADKFTRDIRLLTEALETEPNNPRYHFYLANSYRDVGNTEMAAKHYKKRVELGGWHEEVFYACYELGKLYNNSTEVVYWWLEAYNHNPKRAESLYELVKHYRILGKHSTAQMFLDIAKQIPYPKDDVLFIQTPVYQYLLD